MPLFRSEALGAQDRLYGDVKLVPPVSWQIVGYFLFASLIAAALFLLLASYQRMSVVTGYITGGRGIRHVAPRHAGTIDRVFVREGQSVTAGTPLAEIRIATSADDSDARVQPITAAAAGTVTGITAHPGDPASPATPILSIVSAGTGLVAMLDVPANAAGQIAPGAPIRIAVDAFPYRTFGTVEARLLTISRATVQVIGDDRRAEDGFVVAAPLSRNAIVAYGQPQPLRPGMTVSARIAIDQRSLAGWLFDPMLAVVRR